MFKLNYYYRLKNLDNLDNIVSFKAKKLKLKWYKCTKVMKLNIGEYAELSVFKSNTIINTIINTFWDNEYKYFIESKYNPNIKNKIRRILDGK